MFAASLIEKENKKPIEKNRYNHMSRRSNHYHYETQPVKLDRNLISYDKNLSNTPRCWPKRKKRGKEENR